MAALIRRGRIERLRSPDASRADASRADARGADACEADACDGNARLADTAAAGAAEVAAGAVLRLEPAMRTAGALASPHSHAAPTLHACARVASRNASDRLSRSSRFASRKW